MSVVKHPSQRVAIIIDTQNLYHSAKNLHKARVNFGAVVEQAVAGRQLIRAVSYVVNTESGEENAFFEALEKLGIEIKTKDLQIFYGGAKKADWDVGMAVDAIKIAPKVDAVVFATGDGDFIPAVEYIKSLGCQVEVITFGRSASSALRAACDDFIDMDADPNTFLIRRRRTPTKSSGTTSTRKTTKRATKKTTRKSSSSATIKTVGSDTDFL
ncbi:MAG TPA: NYN domain-containing protein [Candidatus Paceibacterota bacterium]|nr:NYN domain-containing protein [Candidatus Paceibacterota bacterium]